MHHMRAASLALLLALAGLIACGEENPVRVNTAPSGALPPVYVGKQADTSQPKQGHRADMQIRWGALPEGWVVEPGPGMRHSTITIGDGDAAIEMSITPLGARAADPVQNINRWRGQLNLAPLTEEDVERLLTPEPRGAGSVLVVEMANPANDPAGAPQRMLAALIARPTVTWFFKLAGPDQPVAAQRAAFKTFVKSVRFPDEPDTTDPPADE